MAKRANNEGTIHRLQSGSWRAQISLNGKRTGHTAKTKRECQEWLKEAIAKKDVGLSYSGKWQSFDEFLDDWLITVEPSVRNTTYYQYEMTCRKYIKPFLGQKKLYEIQPEMIQKLYIDRLHSGKSARTVRIIHVVLHMAFSYAVKLGTLVRNPTKATTPPKVEKHEMHFFDEIQVSHFLQAARGDRHEALYYLAIVTGMRQSEILGLKWSDLDWKKKTLKVQRQLKRQFNQQDYFCQPKTAKGARTLVLGSRTIEKLREHWERQNLERICNEGRWQENDLIFPSTIGTPMNQSNLYRQFKDLIKNAGLPDIRFHDLRHTAASLMLNHGVPPIVASRRLGHSTVSMTLDIYGHLMPEMQNEAAEMIDDLVTPIEVPLHTVAHDMENVLLEA